MWQLDIARTDSILSGGVAMGPRRDGCGGPWESDPREPAGRVVGAGSRGAVPALVFSLCAFGLSGVSLASASEGPSASAPEPLRTDVGRSGYAEKLEKVDPKEGSDKGVKLEVAVIPDAYAYFMALAIADLEKKGFEGEELLRKAREQHSICYRKYRDRVLFRVVMKASGADYFFLEQAKEIKGHFRLEQEKKTRPLAIAAVSPEPRYETWKLFTRKMGDFQRRSLAALSEIKLEFTTASLKVEGREPFKLILKDVMAQGRSESSFDSVNPGLRQASTEKTWEDRTTRELPLEFAPGTWSHPVPPRRFQKLLDDLSGNAPRDRVYRRRGPPLEGTLLDREPDGGIVLRNEAGRLQRVREAEIDQVVRRDLPPDWDAFFERRRGVTKGLEDWRKLGDFCKKKGADLEHRICLRQILALAPADEEAHRALGETLVAGKWVPPEVER